MPLPASGQISISEIQTEFGGSNPISLSEYYAADDGVPASGTISFSDFYGTAASSGSVVMNASYVATKNSINPTAAVVIFTSTGQIDLINGTDGTWWSDYPETGIGSDYEIRATIVSGTVSSGTTGSWLALTSGQFWSRDSGALNVEQTVVLTIEIRDVATSTVQDSTTVTLNSTQLDTD